MNNQDISKEELISEFLKLQKSYDSLQESYLKIGSQHKQKGQEFIETDRKYKDLFEKSQDAILIIENGKFVDCNKATIEMLRYKSKDEFLNTHPSELSPEIQPDGKLSFSKAEEMMQIAIKSGGHRFEWNHKKADGEIFPVEVLLTSISSDDNNKIIYTVWRDITERKQIETELIESKERYRLISDLTSDYIFYSEIKEDGSSIPVWIDGSFENITGYNVDEYKLAGGWFGTMHPDDIEIDRKAFEKMKLNKNSLSIVRIYHKNGNIVHVKSYGHPIWDKEKNRLAGVIGAVEDITEQKKAEMVQNLQYNIADAMVKSNTLVDFLTIVRTELSSIMATENFYVAFYNENTGMLRADVDADEKDSISEWPAAESLTGHLIKQGITKLYTKNDILELIESKSANMVGTLPECWLGVPLIVDRKAIGAIVVQSYNNPNEYNQYHVSIFQLIANQLSVYIRNKESENQVVESEKSFRGLFQTIGDAIYILDFNSKFIDVNNGAIKMYGYEKYEMIGKTPEFFSAPKKNNLAAVMEHILLAQKGLPQRFEFWGKKKTGDIFPKSVSLFNGNYFGKEVVIAVARDISELKQIEEKLKTLNEFLFTKNEEYENLNLELKESLDKIRVMNLQLIQAKEKAEESDRLKSAFLANMSHEIRTPMNGILGFADLLKDPILTDEDRYHFINIIENSGLRMLNIINDLIDISKVESGQMEVFKSKIEINELLEYIYNFFKPEVENKGMRLRYLNPLASKHISIFTDREKLYAILTNLVKNAIKYCDTGIIEFGYKKKKNEFEFYVKDTGIGIDKNRQEAIFDRFVQADISDKRALAGAGLGLTITKAYVEMLGGRIWVESEKDKGSVFYFTIPE